MTNAINWRDEYYVSKDRICLTNQELQIPGIRMFGTHSIRNAICPLVPHYHEDAFEFTYIAKGSMSYYTSPEEYTVYGGDVFISFPNEIHSTNDTPISLNHQYWFQLDISDPEKFLFLQPDIARQLIKELFQINQHVITAHTKRIGAAIEEAFNLSLSRRNRLLASSCIILFLELLLEETKSIKNSDNPDIEASLLYIRDHIEENLELDQLASLCSLSTSQYKQKFRKVVGVSPRNYINKEKIEYSKKLLQQGCSITDVAMQLNFSSSSYYSTVFKKYTMQSPKEYQSKK